MHGLGGSRKVMRKVASRLAGWRVITMDLRGHGQSSTATWDWAAAVADLAAVIAHCRLDHPYVGGHSLGGMVALQYALSGRPTAGVINIDGWGPGVAGRFPGQDPALVASQLDRIADGELSLLGRLLTAPTRQAREGTTRQVMRLLHNADVVAWHHEAPPPSLAFNATAPPSRALAWLMGQEVARLQSAHRLGLSRDLAVLVQQQPKVTVVEVQANHALNLTHPDVVAAAIETWFSSRSRRRST
jgi:pimeloyl-ACP methyl ester carboxylesterase